MSHKVTLSHTILTEGPDGVEMETEYEITVSYSPSTPDVWYMANGDPGYPGDPEECEILSIKLGALIVPSDQWEAHGFNDAEMEKITEAARESASDAAQDYDDSRDDDRERSYE